MFERSLSLYRKGAHECVDGRSAMVHLFGASHGRYGYLVRNIDIQDVYCQAQPQFQLQLG